MLLLEANVSNTFIYILSGVIIGILISGIGFWLYMRKKSGGRDIHGEENATKVIEQSEYNPPIEKRFSEQLSSKLIYFSGSMNALSNLVEIFNIKNADLTFENIEQIIGLHGDEGDKKSFVNDRSEWDERLYREKAHELLNLFRGYGIEQSKEKHVKWDAESAKRYRKTEKMEVGQECEVVAPYWIYEGDIFERGVVRPK